MIRRAEPILDLAIATCRRLPEPDPDAAPLAAALRKRGIDFASIAWDDPDADWRRARSVVIRSTWNYPQHVDSFLAWAQRVEQHSTLWNPLPVVRWNVHKRYLVELESRGVPVTPTVVLPRGGDVSLAALMRERGWSVAVVKPAESAGSFRTIRVDHESIAAGEQHLASLLAERDALVQPYLSSVDDYGERAIVWVDGRITHAVRKSPRFAGGGESVSRKAVEISSAEVSLVERVLAQVEGPILYARVDVAPGEDGVPLVMELELIEPSLFFDQGPEALERFVAAIARRLS